MQVEAQRALVLRVQKSAVNLKYLHEATSHAPYHECQLQRSEAAVLPVVLQRFSSSTKRLPNLWGLAKRYVHDSHARELRDGQNEELKSSINQIRISSRSGLLRFNLFDDQASVLSELYPKPRLPPPTSHQQSTQVRPYKQLRPFSSAPQGLDDSRKRARTNAELCHVQPWRQVKLGLQAHCRLPGCSQLRRPRFLI